MAGIDSSIYFQQQPLDIMGSIQRGLSMRDMIDKRDLQKKQIAEDDAIKAAYKAGVVQNPDGTTGYNSEATASQLMGINPQKGLEFKAQQQAQVAADQKAKYEKAKTASEFFGRVSNQIKDQYSYESAMNEAKRLGADTSMMPPQWGPDAKQKIDYFHGQALSVKEQLERNDKDRDFNLRKEELGIKRQEVVNKRNEKSEKEKELSVAQAKQMGLYKSGVEAEKQYNAAVSKKGWNKFDPSSNFQWIDKNDWAPKLIKSDESIEAQSAQDRWVEAFLRDASGAAIPPSERGAYAKDFFPVAGDSEQAVKDKAAARKQKMENSLLGAGNQGEKIARQKDIKKTNEIEW